MNVDVSAAQLDPFGIGWSSGSNNLFGMFMGTPSVSRTDNYQHRNVDVWTLPENYKGQNLVLRDTIEDWMWTADQNFYTQRLMPWRVTEQVSIKWEQFEANAHIMPLVPYMTPSPLVTQKRKFIQAQVVRRGLSAQFENGFMGTPMGRSAFLATLGQLGRSAQETANLDCIMALVSAHRYTEQHHRELGVTNERLLEDNMRRDVERFAIVQKTPNGLVILDSQISSEMHTFRGVANAYVIPEEVSRYAELVRRENTEYWLAGQPAVDRIAGVGGVRPSAGSGPALNRVEATHMVAKNDAYICKPLHVDGIDRDQEELLTRIRQTGEYFQMLDDPDDVDYESRHRSILVYDEDIDDMTRIDLMDALRGAGCWDGDNVRAPSMRNGANVDLDQSFMSYLTDNGRDPVQFIFQIYPTYLSTDFLIRAGRTLLKAAGGSFAQVNDFLTNMGITRANAAEKLVGESIQQQQPQGPSLDAIETAAKKMFLAPVPESHIAQISAILDGPGLFQERLEIAKGKIIKFVEDGVPGMRFQDTSPAEDYCKKAIDGYTRNVAQVQQRLQQSQAQEGLAGIGMFAWSDPVATLDEQRRQNASDRDVANQRLLARHTDNINSYPASDDVRKATKVYLELPFTLKTMVALVTSNVIIPMNFLLLRPHQQYATKTIIKCQQDGGCGFTFIGNSNLIMGTEAQRKMSVIHYTTHMRSVVTAPKNVYVQPDVMVVRCEGGAGCRFWTPEMYERYDAENLAASIIAVAVPPAERRFPSPLDTSGRFYSENKVSLTAGQRGAPLHYSTAGLYNEIYGFYKNKDGSSDVPHVGPGRNHKNRICYQGFQCNYNPGTKDFDRKIVNKGHWGKNVYPGCKQVRQGAMLMFAEQHYQTSMALARN